MTDMPTNQFKQRLLSSAGDVQFGLFCGLADPVAAEICAGAGFDWITLDIEHSPNDLRTVLHQLQAIESSGTSVMVRPDVGSTVVIKKLLDIGAQTLLVPMIESAEQAADVVSSCRYPPMGRRGVGASLARASRWNRVADYVHLADNEICVVAQVESVAGVVAIEAIAGVEGVDALFVGPSDLAASMGLIGQTAHPDVVDAVDDAIRRIVMTGRPAGVFATTSEAARRCIDVGATFVAVGADVSVLAAATSDLVRRLRA